MSNFPHSSSSRSIAESESDAYFTDAQSHLSEDDLESLVHEQDQIGGQGATGLTHDIGIPLSPQHSIATITDDPNVNVNNINTTIDPDTHALVDTTIADADITQSQDIGDTTMTQVDESSKQTAQPLVEPVVETVAEPVAGPVTVPDVEPVTGPVTEKIVEPTENAVEAPVITESTEKPEPSAPEAASTVSSASASSSTPLQQDEKLAYVQQQPQHAGQPELKANGTEAAKAKARGYQREHSQCHEYYCQCFCFEGQGCDFAAIENFSLTSLTCCCSSIVSTLLAACTSCCS